MKLTEKQKAKLKDVAIRSIKTFIETAIGCLVISFSGVAVTDLSVVKAIIGSTAVSAIATGVCAVWNGVLAPLFKSERSTANEQKQD